MSDMTAEERDDFDRCLDEFDKDPLGYLRTYEIEKAICSALGKGGWHVTPGDGCGIVANMMRDVQRAAEAAAYERAAEIAWEYARGERQPSGTSLQQGDDIATAIRKLADD